MSTEVSEEEIHHLLENRAKRLRKRLETTIFYIHFALYSVVNIALAIIWRVTGGGFPWFALPLGIWGIFILLHFLMVSVFAGRGPRARDWVRAVTEKDVERLKEVSMTAEEMEHLREMDTLHKGGN